MHCLCTRNNDCICASGEKSLIRNKYANSLSALSCQRVFRSASDPPCALSPSAPTDGDDVALLPDDDAISGVLPAEFNALPGREGEGVDDADDDDDDEGEINTSSSVKGSSFHHHCEEGGGG